MKLADLIRRFRTLAGDKQQPYLWEDGDVAEWLADAQAQACIRGRLLREDEDADITEVALSPSVATYPLHPAVYEIINAAIVDADGKRRPLELVSREWLENTVREWRTFDRPACYLIQDDTRVRVVGHISTGDMLKLECYRLPKEQLGVDTDDLEIHQAHHEHLIQWALHKAFSITDADGYDAARSDKAEQAFTRYFGLMPDSDLRRITRHDVPHHVVPVLP